MFNWFPEIMHNVYHENFIREESGSKPITKYSELQTMCTKYSNPLAINLFTHRLTTHQFETVLLKDSYGAKGQDLLTTTIPCSGDDLVGLQLKNDRISILALPLLVTHKEKCSWRICIINQPAKIISKLRFLTW